MSTQTQSTPRANEPAQPLSCLARDARVWLGIIVVAGAVLAAFGPALYNGFALDETAILNNPHIRHVDPAMLRWVFTSWEDGRYQPLTWLSYAANHALGGLSPAGYHLTNLILHFLASVLVYLVALRLIAAATQKAPAGGATWATHAGALAAALLWGLHPLRVDAVTWASQRAFPLGSVFALLSVLFYVRSGTGPCRRFALVAAVTCYGLSLLAGPFAVMLPVALLALEIYPLRRLRGGRAVWLDKLLFLPLAAVVGGAGVWQLWTHITTAPPGVGGRIVLVIQSLAFHIWKTVWPTGLVPVYELHLPLDLNNVFFLSSAGAVALAFVLLVGYARHVPALIAAASAYVALLLPVSGIVPLGHQEMGERYGYLAIVAGMIALGGGIAWLANQPQRTRRTLAAGTSALVLIAAAVLGTLTRQQCRVWRTADTLWSHVYARFESGPICAIAAYHVAQDLERAGDWARAVNLYELALIVRPGLPGIYERLGQLQSAIGDYEGALTTYRSAVAAHPKSAGLQRGYGLTLAATGLLGEAEPRLRRALELEPDDAATHRALGNLLLFDNRVAEAIAEFQAAVAADPRDAEALYDLGRAQQHHGDRAAALEAYRRTLELDPAHALARRAVEEWTGGGEP